MWLLLKQGILNTFKNKTQVFIFVILIVLTALFSTVCLTSFDRLQKANKTMGYGTLNIDYNYNYISTNYEANNQQTITPWFAFDVDYAGIGNGFFEKNYGTLTIGGPDDVLKPFDLGTGLKGEKYQFKIDKNHLQIAKSGSWVPFENILLDYNAINLTDNNVLTGEFSQLYRFNFNAYSFQKSLLGQLYKRFIFNNSIDSTVKTQAINLVKRYMHFILESRLTYLVYKNIEVYALKNNTTDTDLLNQFINGANLGEHWQTKNLGIDNPGKNVARADRIFLTPTAATDKYWGMRGTIGFPIYDPNNTLGLKELECQNSTGCTGVENYRYFLTDAKNDNIVQLLNDKNDHSNVTKNFLLNGSYKVRNLSTYDFFGQYDYNNKFINNDFLTTYQDMLGMISNFQVVNRNQAIAWTTDGKKYKFIDWTQPYNSGQLKILQKSKWFDRGLNEMVDTAIVLPQYFKANHLRFDDTILVNQLKLYIEAVGGDTQNIYPTIYDTDFLPDAKNESIVYVHPQMFNRLFGYNNEGFTSQQYQDVSTVQLTYYGDNQNKKETDLSYYRVYLADNINRLGKTVEAIFQNKTDVINNVSFSKFDANQLINNRYQLLNNAIKIYHLVIIGIVIFFAIIIMIILFIQLKSMIEKQRSQIGILKANGYNNFKISLSYVMYFLTALIIATPIGWLLGLGLQVPIINLFGQYFILPSTFVINWQVLLLFFLLAGSIIFILVVIECNVILGREVLALINPNRDFKPNKLISQLSLYFTKRSFKTRFRLVLLGASWKAVIMFLVTTFIATGTITLAALVPNSIKTLSKQYYQNLNYANELNYQNIIYNNPLSRYELYDSPSEDLPDYGGVNDPIYQKLENVPIAPYVYARGADNTTKWITLQELATNPNYSASYPLFVVNMLVQNMTVFKGSNISVGLLRYLYDLPTDSNIKTRLDNQLSLVTCTFLPQLFGQSPVSNSEAAGTTWHKWSYCIEQATNTILPTVIKEKWAANEKYQLRFNFGFNSMAYDQKTDSLFTGFDTKIAAVNGIIRDSAKNQISSYGLNVNDNQVVFTNDLKTKLQKVPSKQNKTIPIAINDSAAVKYNLRLNDIINFYTNQPRLQYLGKDQQYYDIKPEWWTYQNGNITNNPWTLNLSHLTNSLLTGTNNDQWGTNVNQPYASISGLKLNLPVNMIDAHAWSQDKIDINPESGPMKVDLLNNKVTKIEQNNYVIGAYDLDFDHPLKSLIDLVNGGFAKNWYGQALKLGLLRVTTSNFNVLSNYQFKVVGVQHSYDQARIFLDQKWANHVLGYQDSSQWFNGKYTKAIQPADQFQRYVLSSVSADNSLNDGLTFFSSAVGKVDYLYNKKQVVNQLSYFTTVLAGAMVSIIILTAVIIIFLVTDVFMERYTKFIALMRVFGYRRGEINSMTLAIFIPFAILGWLLGFFLVWTAVYFAVKMGLQAISLPLSLPMPWLLFIAIFGIISVIFALTFVLSTRKINQLPIQTIVTLSDE
ncbi:hypothetical protein S100390_v1c05800 [Spiroplasma sp. NBRC 100390]|uniref:ABC transporter permease n=1 Tax=unclassified Spiroplasma TaxID=2637901 RepID=UPI00089291DF|nr:MULTISPECIES: ABC transporter permease [unclassified Spiroplasma]AOX43917.1 hypothetical protein STU14_v1c05800 [Spiroplasma sp. TU-14]APE13387.1 hypothetical protein S100390_v1c05800 [Spiroplasma sp. NBRC 100390]